MNSELVSILTPCYNGERFVFRLLDSVLSQTYPQIEMFVIDDGSVDNSAKIIKSYIPKFESRGYSLTYIYQENSGQSVAINKGLKLFSGEYLVWPDCDDFYATDDAIEQMVEVLKDTDNSVSMVRCFSYLLDELSLNQIGFVQSLEYTKGKTDLFEDALLGKNGFWYIPGNYMAKAEKALELIPERSIYEEKKAGQNFQLLFPLLYKHKCLTIEKYLYNILSRESSHSRGQFFGYENSLEKFEIYENTIKQTLFSMKNMPEPTREKYLDMVRINYQANRCLAAFEYKKTKEARRLYKVLQDGENYGYVNKSMRLLFCLSFIPGGFSLHKFIMRNYPKIKK